MLATTVLPATTAHLPATEEIRIITIRITIPTAIILLLGIPVVIIQTVQAGMVHSDPVALVVEAIEAVAVAAAAEAVEDSLLSNFKLN